MVVDDTTYASVSGIHMADGFRSRRDVGPQLQTLYAIPMRYVYRLMMLLGTVFLV